ncbi:Uncharacterised protein [Serratia fonticola]|uniref:Uncharacterized protein n=1 Tax=Serratia fonticola TaxID=47917 RepID=A0A4V6KPA8_SERFO|nr:Uncharacterised protein [Serratia fonticola]
MKIKIASLGFLFLSFNALSTTHYQAGDCITPTDPGYSWYGHVAKVVSFSEIEGYFDKNYILFFPTYKSGDVIFTTEIETQHQEGS